MHHNAGTVVALSVTNGTVPQRTLQLVQAVAALHSSIADLTASNTFAITASELALGAWSGCAAAAYICLIRVVATIVLAITHPSSWNALTAGSTAEFTNIITRWTAFLVLIRVVTTVVLPVTKRPVRYTPI